MRSTGRAALIACVPMFAVLGLGAVAAAPALASSAPSAETRPATAVGEHEATLNGVVNPNGAATKYYFEYGGVKTAEVSAGSGTSYVEVSATITGLKAESKHSFKIVATNSNGTTKGAFEEFWTTGAPGLPEFSEQALGEGHGLKFTATVIGSVVFQSGPGGTTYGCGSGSAEGKFLTAKTATIALKFNGCRGNSLVCATSGDGPEEITTGSLPAQLVYLSKEKHEVALVVNYHETDFAAWLCTGGISAGIHESIIVPLTSVNTKTKSYTLDFVGKEGLQTPAQFEGAEGKVSAFPLLKLLNGIYEDGAVEASMAMTTAEAIEVKA